MRLQCVNSDMKDLGLRVGEAQDRQLWRRKILVKRLSRACMEKQTLNIDDDDEAGSHQNMYHNDQK